MKIIQSFWSKPAFHSVQNYANARKFGGWLNFKYFLISAAYSCLTLRKHNKKVYLYTDSQGQELMIDLLTLPYEDVSVSLNDLYNEDHRLWILGKMHAIEQQQEPFIHVDNDIYMWEPLPCVSKFIVQSRFPIWTEYKLSLNEIFANFDYIPEALMERPTEKTMVANVGIIGGSDIDFFQRFCENSKNLLERNRSYLPVIGIGGFNQMLEEYLFTSMLRHEKKDVFYLMESLKTEFTSSHLNFSLVPVVYKYIHLIGNNKQSAFACEQLELRLKYEFPEYHARVVEVLNDLDVPDTDLKIDVSRHERLLRSLDVFYRNDLASIRGMKVRIRPDAEIIRATDLLLPNEQYFMKEKGRDTLSLLPGFGTEGIAMVLNDCPGKAFTIDELCKALEPSATQVTINSIAANLVQTGLMEFV